MKKSFKKLTLDKKTILTMNEAANVQGGFVGTGSGHDGCGGFKTQPCCPTTITAAIDE